MLIAKRFGDGLDIPDGAIQTNDPKLGGKFTFATEGRLNFRLCTLTIVGMQCPTPCIICTR